MRRYTHTKEKGNHGENAAVSHLLSQGCQIVERNYRCKYGEIDIIAKDGPYLVIAEVKNRSDFQTGYPEEAVNLLKQRKIISTFLYYRMTHQIDEYTPVRFDVISCHNEKVISWIKNAFEYTE